jgi:hypothetical protein
VQPAPPDGGLYEACPVNGSTTINAATKLFSKKPFPREAQYAESPDEMPPPAAHLDPDPLPLAAANSEATTQQHIDVFQTTENILFINVLAPSQPPNCVIHGVMTSVFNSILDIQSPAQNDTSSLKTTRISASPYAKNRHHQGTTRSYCLDLPRGLS